MWSPNAGLKNGNAGAGVWPARPIAKQTNPINISGRLPAATGNVKRLDTSKGHLSAREPQR